jgi:hypothetical protein
MPWILRDLRKPTNVGNLLVQSISILQIALMTAYIGLPESRSLARLSLCLSVSTGKSLTPSPSLSREEEEDAGVMSDWSVAVVVFGVPVSVLPSLKSVWKIR